MTGTCARSALTEQATVIQRILQHLVLPTEIPERASGARPILLDAPQGGTSLPRAAMPVTGTRGSANATLTAAALGRLAVSVSAKRSTPERVYCVDDIPLNASFCMPAPVPAMKMLPFESVARWCPPPIMPGSLIEPTT